MLASLNHPNIATIHALERTSDGHALVMELVEGETLPTRIGRGPLRIKDAVSIAGAMVEALDARWIAYMSDESGRYEIYVESFPNLGARVAISTEGGIPRWTRDGRELFYRQGDAVMAVRVDTARGFRAEKPRRLFAGSYTGAGQDSSLTWHPTKNDS